MHHERQLREAERTLVARAMARWYGRQWLSVDEAIAILVAAKTDKEQQEADQYVTPRMDDATRVEFRARLEAELVRRGIAPPQPHDDHTRVPTRLPPDHHCRVDDLSYTDMGTWYRDHQDVMPARAAIDLEQHMREHGCGFAEAFTALLGDGTIILTEPEAARGQDAETGT